MLSDSSTLLGSRANWTRLLRRSVELSSRGALLGCPSPAPSTEEGPPAEEAGRTDEEETRWTTDWTILDATDWKKLVMVLMGPEPVSPSAPGEELVCMCGTAKLIS